MPISVTCPCGARLEIDEKFLGKEVPCPDCQRPLPTKAPAAPPPLDLPDHRRVSGLAILSLALALVGAFTIVGTLAAIVVGILALKQIARQPKRLDGAEFARAGIIAGAVFTFVTVAAFISPTVFGVDQLVRELRWVAHLDYPQNTEKVEPPDHEITITRPSESWARFKLGEASENIKGNKIILVNVAEDAYIACQFVVLDGEENPEDREKKVLDDFYKSQLVNLVGRLKGKSRQGDGTVSARKPVGAKDAQEVTVDLRLGGFDRRFLIQYAGTNEKSIVLIGCARATRFDRLEDDFRKAFATFKVN